MDYFEPTQVLECTQKISTNIDKSNQVVGHLLIKGINHNLFYGENTIGRDPSCSIVINDKPVSAKHAVLEVENDTLHFIYDLGSSNKTKLRKAFIKPNVRYVLNDGDELVFGNVSAIYNRAQIIPEEFENEVDRTEIFTIPETPEKEDKTEFVAEIPKSIICDSDDSNTDLFDDSQSGRISFQIPNFEIKEDNMVYNISTPSVQKNVSIYEVDTQSFVENNKDNEKNSIIYDINTEVFPEKLKNDQQINERPILLKPSGSFEDLFCDSVQSPVKNIFSSDKFSEDIFQSSQSKSEKIHDSKDLKSQNCIESTSLSKAEINVTSNLPQVDQNNVENSLKLGSNPRIQFFEQNEEIISNLEEDGQIEQEKTSLDLVHEKLENQQNLFVENIRESKDIENENDEIDQDLIFEDKINFVEKKNFWMIESEIELTTEDHEQLKTESVISPENRKNEEKLDKSSNQQNVETKNNCEEHTNNICTIQDTNQENHEDKINFVEPKSLWEMETQVCKAEDHQKLKNSQVDAILEDVQGENEEKLDESSNQPNEEVKINSEEHAKDICTIQNDNEENHENKINFVEPKNLWEFETEVYKAEDHQKLQNSQVDAIFEDFQGENEEKLDHSSNQPNEEVKNNCEEHAKDICTVQHDNKENHEDKINFVEPKNLREFETEVYKSEDHQKLQNSQVDAILEDVQDENNEKLDESSNQLNEEVKINSEEHTKDICTIQHDNEENHGDKINFVEPKNLWEFETEVYKSEDHQKLQNSQVDAILEDVQGENEEKLDHSSNQPNEEVKNNCEEHAKDICTVQHDNEENHENKINFVEPKNLWEFETEVYKAEDHQKLKNNLENSQDVQSELPDGELLKDDELSLDENLKLNKLDTKLDESSNQLNVVNNCEEHIKDICTIQHAEEGLNSQDNINFVGPKSIWEMETEELVENNHQLNDDLEKSEVLIFEDVQNEKVQSTEEDSSSKKICPDESSNQKILNFVGPKKIETDVLNTEDQKLQDNLEKCGFAPILKDIESEKVQSVKKIQLLKDDKLDQSLKLNTKVDKSINNVVFKNNCEDINDICVIPYVNLNKDLNNHNFVGQKIFKETQELTTDQEQLKENMDKSQISLALEDVQNEFENKEKSQVLSEQIEQKSSEKIENNLKIASSVQEVLIQEDDHMDSTLEDEGFTGFEPHECVVDFPHFHNANPKKLDVEFQMSILFGTSSETQTKIIMNGEGDVNFLKKMLEETTELEPSLETQKTEFEIRNLKFEIIEDIKVDQNDVNLSEIDVVERTTQDIKVDENNDNLSEMTTQAVLMNFTEIDAVERTTQDINVDENNDNLNMSLSDMCTQAVLINSTEVDVVEKTSEDINFDENNDNLSEMTTQAVLINPTEIDVVERTTQDIKVDQNNDNLSEMTTQAVLINPTEIDVVERTTQDIKVDQNNDNLNMSLSDMCTQAVKIDTTKIDVVERTTQDIKVDQSNDYLNMSLSDMCTQTVKINPTEIDVVERITQDIKVDQNSDNLNMSLSDMCTQAVINPTQVDVVEKPTQDINYDQNLSEMTIQAVQIDMSEKLTQNINFDQNKPQNSDQNILEDPKIQNKNQVKDEINKTDSAISEDIIPSKKVRKSRINMNANKKETNVKPKLALHINKHSSTLPDINRSSFFINQQKTSQSLILESNKNLLDSSDDDDCPNKRPRLFVISDDEDDEPLQKSENAFKIDFKNEKKSVRLKNKIYNSNESIYSAVSMDETVIKSDMEETLISKKCNQNSKFTMSPFLSKIIESEEISPKTVSPKSKEFGRGKRTRVVKMFKDFETDDTVDEILNKKIKLGAQIQPSGSNEHEVKQKRSRVAKNKSQNLDNLCSTAELSSEDSQIRKNTRSRKTPIVQLVNVENISNKPSKMTKKIIKPEENLDLNERNDCTENKKISYERSSRKRRTATSETSSNRSISSLTNEGNSVDKPGKSDCTENDQKTYGRSTNRKRTTKSSASETSSNRSISSSTKEKNIQNPSKMTKKQSEENISVDKPEKSDCTEKNQKTYERSTNRKRTTKSSASETSSNRSISSSTKEKNIQNPSKMTKKQSEENISVDKPEKSDCTEKNQKTYERSTNRKRTTKSSASETSSNRSISSSTKEENIQNPSKMTKKQSEENISVDEPGKSDCTENDQKTYKRSNRKKPNKSSASVTSSNGSISSSTKEQNIQNPSKITKNTKKPPEENISVDKPGKSDSTKNDKKTNERSNNRKKTTKSSVSESSNVPMSTSTSSTRVTRSRGKNGSKNEHGKLKILFNGDYDEDMPLIIDRLNGEIVENPYTCTVVVAENFEPTVNLLCGLSQGRPIVSSSWLHCSLDAGYFIDPYKHLLMDKKAEEKFSFCLKNSINKATQSQLLKGWSIFATPSTKPSPEELKSIVECSGGVFLKKLPSRKTQNILVISCPDDEIKSKIIPKIVSSETFITGVLRQNLDFNA